MNTQSLVDLPDYSIRYTIAEDEPYLYRWLMLPNVQKWFSFSDEKEVEETIKIWIAYSKYKCSLTAIYQDIPIGIATLFLMPYVKLIHHGLGNIVVDPEYQNKGVGSSLIKNLDHLASSYFRLERMQYEIFGDNPILSLLHKQGYDELFIQEKFIKDNGLYQPRRIVEKVFKK